MKNFSNAIILSGILTLLNLLNHLIPLNNSLINFTSIKINKKHSLISDENISSIIEYHKSNIVFARRPLTTFLIENLSSFLSFSESLSFIVINFFLLFLSGIALYYLANYLLQNKTYSLLSVTIYHLSFSNFFAFFDTIYCYDEPLQYLFLFLSILFILYERWIIFLITFSISIISRESSLLFVPTFLLLNFYKKKEINDNRYFDYKIIFFAIPVILYFCYLYIYLFFSNNFIENRIDFSNRLDHFKFNFQNQNFAIEGFFTFFLTTGLQLYVLVFYRLRYKFDKQESKFIKSFISLFILNSIIVIFSTKIREARLLTLPLILLWPFLGKFVWIEISSLFKTNKIKSLILNKWFLFLFLFAIFLEYLIYKYVYIPSVNAKGGNFQDEYLYIILVFITFHFLGNFFLFLKNSSYKIYNS
jgi:hypothetical protein